MISPFKSKLNDLKSSELDENCLVTGVYRTSLKVEISRILRYLEQGSLNERINRIT